MIPVIYPMIGLVVCLVFGFALEIYRGMRSFFRSIYRRCGAAGVLFFAIFAACMIRAAGTKPTPIPSATLRWDTGLYDNGSVATNDNPVISFRYSSYLASDTLYIDYRPKGSTNDLDWVNAYYGIVSESNDITLYIQNCVDQVIYIYTRYVPPPPEHTNGVYHIDNLSRPLDDFDAEKWIPLRTPVRTDRYLLAPPDLPRPSIPILLTQPEIDDFLNND